MSVINKMKDVSSQSLLAYLNVLDNCHQSASQIINSCMDLINKGELPAEDAHPIIRRASLARNEYLDILEDVQKEIDVRMKRDLGINVGIRKTQILLADFETLIVAVQNREQKKWDDEIKKAKEEDNADTSES